MICSVTSLAVTPLDKLSGYFDSTDFERVHGQSLAGQNISNLARADTQCNTTKSTVG